MADIHHMTEPTTTGAAGVYLLKVYGLKLMAGTLAAALMFAVLWPRTAREGVSRIACTLAGSMLGGEPLLAIVRTSLAWWPEGQEAAMLVYVGAGLPAWWVLGAIARWLDKRRDRDIAELAADARRDIAGQ